jgi:hypothetical protein
MMRMQVLGRERAEDEKAANVAVGVIDSMLGPKSSSSSWPLGGNE